MTDYLCRRNSSYDDAYYLQRFIENKLSLSALMIASVMLQEVVLRDHTRIDISGRNKEPSSLPLSFQHFRLTNFHRINIFQSEGWRRRVPSSRDI